MVKYEVIFSGEVTQVLGKLTAEIQKRKGRARGRGGASSGGRVVVPAGAGVAGGANVTIRSSWEHVFPGVINVKVTCNGFRCCLGVFLEPILI